MKIAGLFGKVRGGKWITLSTPDVPLAKQKTFFKQLRVENGRGLAVEGRKVDLEELILFDTSGAKHCRFKAVKPLAERLGYISNLNALAEALGIERDELDEVRKHEGFPMKEKEGYCVESVKKFIDGQA